MNSLSSWDPYLHISLEFLTIKESEGNNTGSTVNIRIPFWTLLNGAEATLNDENLTLSEPGNFLTITREWKTGDKLSLLLPVEIRTEKIKDYRSQFASVQAIFFGPYLLAGMTRGDSDLSLKNINSLSESVSAVPDSFSSQLFSFCQKGKISHSSVLDNSTLVFSESNNTILMEPFPMVGTNNAASATFRIIELLSESKNSEFRKRKVNSIKDFVGSEVYLEPFALPGMLVSHEAANNPVSIINRPQFIDGNYQPCTEGICNLQSPEMDSVFQVRLGLDGENSSVSFESANLPNCFLYGITNYEVGQAVQLRCKPSERDPAFNHAASFSVSEGIAKYHPISFIARGSWRAYLLSPLNAFRDESYTVYFNITS